MAEISNYDIVVIGGGVAGTAAAVSAARYGASVILVEHYGFLGGWATAALVNPFMSHCTSDSKQLIAGIFDEILLRLQSMDALLVNSFDSEAMKFLLQEMLLESDAQMLLHTDLDAARYTDTDDICLTLRCKEGPRDIICHRLIDCSGDGDASVALGASYEMGGDDGLPQAVTLMFDVGGVDLEAALTYVRDHPDQVKFPKLTSDANPAELASDIISVAGYFDLVERARKIGDYEAPGDMIFYIGRPRKGEVVFNTTHVGRVDGTKSSDLTRAEIESRRQMMSVVSFVRKYIPGFENAYLLRSATQVGVRETRRIVGDYRFSADDVARARKFGDAICRLAYPVDVHTGKGDGYTKEEQGYFGLVVPPPGDWYEIPYSCLLPVGLDNVLIAGRCVSSSQAGHGAIRIMPACAAMGEAAGTAAAMSIETGCNVRDIDRDNLLIKLREQGALV